MNQKIFTKNARNPNGPKISAFVNFFILFFLIEETVFINFLLFSILVEIQQHWISVHTGNSDYYNCQQCVQINGIQKPTQTGRIFFNAEYLDYGWYYMARNALLTSKNLPSKSLILKSIMHIHNKTSSCYTEGQSCLF